MGQGFAFLYLHHNGGKEFDINVSGLRSMTFKHYVEMSLKVPYRYPKYFLADYTDENGVTEERCYSMYVRDLSVKMKSSQNNAFFEEKGVGQSVEFHGGVLNLIDLPKAYEALKLRLATENPNDNGRRKYLAGKRDFILDALRKAAEWRLQ